MPTLTNSRRWRLSAILAKLPNTKYGARIRVLATTGLPHAQIMRLEPHQVDLDRRQIQVTPRRKGAGTKARTLPLTFAAVEAFTLFTAKNAWGPFSRHNLRRTFREAVRKARETWAGRWPAQENLRPYDLRHAFLTEVYRRTKDLRATAELAMHSDLSMTARYAEAAVTATASAARDLMDSEAPKMAPRRKVRKKR